MVKWSYSYNHSNPRRRLISTGQETGCVSNLSLFCGEQNNSVYLESVQGRPDGRLITIPTENSRLYLRKVCNDL
jgi:hypothetical protein